MHQAAEQECVRGGSVAGKLIQDKLLVEEQKISPTTKIVSLNICKALKNILYFQPCRLKSVMFLI